ncbi:MAG: membrane protein insertase YidC [Crocinitomicaceae bacterium]|nr:membrane protein insertase YidC [Crocinitomicaceae bacterium]
MDRNTITGFLLIFAMVIVYQLYFVPAPQELAEDQAQTVSTPETPSLVSDFRATEVANVLDSTYTSKLTKLRSDVLEVEITTDGGTPIRATLQDGYLDFWNRQPIQLWTEGGSDMNFVARGEVSYDQSFDVVSQSESEVVLANRGDGPLKTLTYTIDGYLVDVQAAFEDARGEVGFQWQADGAHNEKGIDVERQKSSIYFREQGRGRDYLYEGRDDSADIEDPVEWVAFKQNYFSAIVGTDAGFTSGTLRSLPPTESADTLITMRYGMDVRMPTVDRDGREVADLRFYFGPNDVSELNATGWGEIGRVIDFGWWIFGWINRNVIFPIYAFLAQYMGSAGLIILVLTIAIKSILFPITWKNYVSSAKMRLLKPDMEEINTKYPNQEDAMQRQQETMKLYRESGVNPLAGCIPQLIQMPLLYAMFRFFPANIELRGKSFLWADDLGAYDSILDLPFEIPFYGAHVSGFTVLMAGSMFVYMGQTMAQQAAPTQPGMPDMRIMARIMPLFMLFFFNKFASGLSLYYFIANLITIGQVTTVKKFFINEDKIREKIKAKQAEPKEEKKKSGFAARLEAMQKEQQQKAEEMKRQRDQSRKSRNQKRKK